LPRSLRGVYPEELEGLAMTKKDCDTVSKLLEMKFSHLYKCLPFMIGFMLCLLFPVNVFSVLDSSPNLDERKNEIIISGLHLLYSGKWEEAIRYFKRLDEIDPVSSEGTFF
jgi:hypothetical protein